MKGFQSNILSKLALAAALVPTGGQVALSTRVGASIGLLIMPLAVSAQGFVRGMSNLNTLMQVMVGLLITLGLLGGLGFIMGGLWAAYKKHNERGSDEITWGKIAVQIGVGGLAMALGWVGVNVVETLGGSPADIGRSIR